VLSRVLCEHLATFLSRVEDGQQQLVLDRVDHQLAEARDLLRLAPPASCAARRRVATRATSSLTPKGLRT